jgi:DNA-binding IscR family transcriptional regulator
VAYSTAFSQAISILLLINLKMEELKFEFVSAKTISKCMNIPAPTVVKILKNLNLAGITATNVDFTANFIVFSIVKVNCTHNPSVVYY